MNRQQRRMQGKNAAGPSGPAAGLHAQALACFQNGDLAQAEGLCRHILSLSPKHGDSLYLLGLIYGRVGRHDLAQSHIAEAMRHDKRAPHYPYGLGNAQKALGNLAAAIDSYRQAVRLKPDFVEAWNNLGSTLLEIGQPTPAQDAFRKAVAARPDFAEAHGNLGQALLNQGRTDDAIAAFQHALSLNPGLLNARNNLGTAYQRQDRLDLAMECYDQTIALQPSFAKAHINKSSLLQDQSRCAEAIDAAARALELAPDSHQARLNMAVAQLALGDYPQGLANYEARLSLAGYAPRPMPRWAGESLTGKTLLVWAEQGMGDTIQFCRYITSLQTMGAKVVLEVQRPLVRLLDELEVPVFAQGETLPAADFHCPLLSLPLMLGTKLETIPAAVPYLKATPRVGLPAANGLRVGLVWRGNPNHKGDRYRSARLEDFAPLLSLPGVTLVCLQKDPTPEEAAWLAENSRIQCPDLGDFADTAAIMADLDLVISVDTSICHLAGAMGLPTWVLVGFAPDWRWLLDRTDSPWYPTIRLFRKTGPIPWDQVMGQVRDALAEKIPK